MISISPTRNPNRPAQFTLLRPLTVYNAAKTHVARNPWMRDGEIYTLWTKTAPDGSEVIKRIFLKRTGGFAGLYAEAGGHQLRYVHNIGMIYGSDGPMQVSNLSAFGNFLDWLYRVLPEMERYANNRHRQIKQLDTMPGLWVTI